MPALRAFSGGRRSWTRMERPGMGGWHNGGRLEEGDGQGDGRTPAQDHHPARKRRHGPLAFSGAPSVRA